MKDKLFLMFQKENNPVDAIIEMFKSAGWKFTESLNPYYSKYVLPDIILSASNSHFEGMEAMGLYRARDKDWKLEGEIVLYYNTIQLVAEDYCKKNNDSDIDKIVSDLTEIVYVHECIHWIMHWIESPTYGMSSCLNNKFIPLDYDYAKMETVEFHEAFAQLFTHFYLELQEDKKKLFYWLVKGQPYQYLKFEEILNWNISSGQEAVKLLSFIRLFNYQSFVEIEKCISCLPEFKIEKSFSDTLSNGGLLRILETLTHNEIIKCLVNVIWDDNTINCYVFRGLLPDKGELLAEEMYPFIKEKVTLQEIKELINDQTSNERFCDSAGYGFI